VADRNSRISVIGVAGPGDPLANEETFEALRAINREYPELTLCVSTNGLLLPERLPDLIRAGVRSLTVTINAITCETAGRIYEWVSYKGRRLTGREAARVLLANQWSGLRAAAREGLLLKVNTVLIPGVNEAEVPRIAEFAGERGADLMNILPLIPQASFASLTRPTHKALCEMRGRCAGHIRQMTHCRQCRADAFGALGEDGDMELEMVYARLGEDYCESVA
jgi:nitrogen fixation protein NifB